MPYKETDDSTKSLDKARKLIRDIPVWPEPITEEQQRALIQLYLINHGCALRSCSNCALYHVVDSIILCTFVGARIHIANETGITDVLTVLQQVTPADNWLNLVVECTL